MPPVTPEPWDVCVCGSSHHPRDQIQTSSEIHCDLLGEHQEPVAVDLTCKSAEVMMARSARFGAPGHVPCHISSRGTVGCNFAWFNWHLN